MVILARVLWKYLHKLSSSKIPEAKFCLSSFLFQHILPYWHYSRRKKKNQQNILNWNCWTNSYFNILFDASCKFLSNLSIFANREGLVAVCEDNTQCQSTTAILHQNTEQEVQKNIQAYCIYRFLRHQGMKA